MDVILSIKPNYVEKILSYEKQYEFRRRIFKQDVCRVIIYSTAPIKKFVGFFELKEVVDDTPYNLWSNFSDVAGIDEVDFFNYFEDCEVGFALKISNLKIFNEPVDVSHLDGFTAPQSFKYINENKSSKLLNLR